MNWKRWLIAALVVTPIVFAMAAGNTETKSSVSDSASATEQYPATTAVTAPPAVKTAPTILQPTAIPTAPAYAPRGTYENVYGNQVPRPYYSDTVPAGATARCNDGTYSFSQSRRGTCSGHGGVDEWL